jgi:hypothetical protein
VVSRMASWTTSAAARRQRQRHCSTAPESAPAEPRRLRNDPQAGLRRKMTEQGDGDGPDRRTRASTRNAS